VFLNFIVEDYFFKLIKDIICFAEVK